MHLPFSGRFLGYLWNFIGFAGCSLACALDSIQMEISLAVLNSQVCSNLWQVRLHTTLYRALGAFLKIAVKRHHAIS
ncbi:hypothetical protein B0H10DRAFT_682119 [Mycena sp. CBHHK59/15]|nr:hypothetical protein B0H10DRAFT_682119 [Mycena sp. CBHHK59/15]